MEKHWIRVFHISHCGNFRILREINFEDSRSAKSAISIYFEGLNIGSYEILHFLKAEIYQTAALELQASPKLISRKIRMTQ